MSPETPDGELLRLYVRRRSEAAFGLLVRRHLNLVYVTCLREVGDAALAEDAALSVFLVLARRASSLRGGIGGMAVPDGAAGRKERAARGAASAGT